MAEQDPEDRIKSLERQLERERRFNADLLKQNQLLNTKLALFNITGIHPSEKHGVDMGTQTRSNNQDDGTTENENQWATEADSQGASIADSVKAFLTIKSSEIFRKDFVYNEGMGMYYNAENGMMYDGKRYLYYDYGKNCYLYYDEETGEYKEDAKIKQPSRKRKSKKRFKNIVHV